MRIKPPAKSGSTAKNMDDVNVRRIGGTGSLYSPLSSTDLNIFEVTTYAIAIPPITLTASISGANGVPTRNLMLNHKAKATSNTARTLS